MGEIMAHHVTRARQEADRIRRERDELRRELHRYQGIRLSLEERGREAWAASGGAEAVRQARQLREQLATATAAARRARDACEVDPWSERIRRPHRETMAEAMVGIAPDPDPLRPWRASMWQGDTVLARGRVIGARLERGEVVAGTPEDLERLARWVSRLWAD
jgi:hypothetical protein